MPKCFHLGRRGHSGRRIAEPSVAVGASSVRPGSSPSEPVELDSSVLFFLFSGDIFMFASFPAGSVDNATALLTVPVFESGNCIIEKGFESIVRC